VEHGSFHYRDLPIQAQIRNPREASRASEITYNFDHRSIKTAIAFALFLGKPLDNPARQIR
jgi:hypothetical protein